MNTFDAADDSPWEIRCISIPDRALVEQIRRRLFSPLGRDIFLAYSGMPSLRFCGFLVTEIQCIDRPLAFCPVTGGLEVGSTLWQRDVQRQLNCAVGIAITSDVGFSCDVIDIRARSQTQEGIPKWVYGFSCVPLTQKWDGTLARPQPFCPALFTAMSRLPEASAWIRQQVVRGGSSNSGLTLGGHHDPHLPPRQRSVLEGLCSGMSEKQIARWLSLSQHTVHTYVKNIYRAYGVNSRSELLASFIDSPSKA